MSVIQSFYANFVSTRPVPGAVFIRLHSDIGPEGVSVLTELSTKEAIELRDNLTECIQASILCGAMGIAYDNNMVIENSENISVN